MFNPQGFVLGVQIVGVGIEETPGTGRQEPHFSRRDEAPSSASRSGSGLGESQLELRQLRLSRVAASLEQLVPRLYLGVLWVFNLDPTRTATVRLVRALGPLAHDTLEITRARGAIQILAAPWDVIQEQQPAFDFRHDAQQSPLPLDERQTAHVLTVHGQQIERVEVRPVSTKQQLVEIAATVRIETADFTIENGIMRPDGVRDFLGELRPGFAHVPVARDQLAVMPADVRERSEAIDLRLEHELGMVERLGNAQEPHRRMQCRHRAEIGSISQTRMRLSLRAPRKSIRHGGTT
jgi:hypothetical protein